MLNLKPFQVEIIKNILKKNIPELTVWAFGSRVNNTAKPHSDLDLVVLGNTPIEEKIMFGLKDDFEESDLPIRVDVLDWNTISDSFKQIIEKNYLVLQ